MLLALAEHADQFGYCFPGLQRLASMCQVSESTAHRMIRLLVSRNLITIERRFNENGSCRSNGYRLAIDHPVNLTGRSVSVTGGTVSTVTGSGVTHDRETTTESVSYERPLQPARTAPAAEVSRLRRGNNRLCFPKAVSEAEREVIEAQVAALTVDDAQQVLDELAGRMDTTRVRNPVSYCARLIQRLERGAFHPVAGLEVAKQREAGQREQRTLSERALTTLPPVNGAHHRLDKRIQASLERMRSKQLGEQNDEGPKTSS